MAPTASSRPKPLVISAPAISALVPIKNGANFLPDFMPNVLSSLSQSDELVIVDNGSTDNSLAVLHQWAKIDKRITVVELSDVGLVKALNFGISVCKFEWIARFDVDDEYAPKRLDFQRQLISTKVVLMFSDYSLMTEKKFPLGTIPSAISSAAMKLSFFSGQRTAHSSALFRRSIAIKVGGYLPDDYPAEDLSLWLRMSSFGEVISVPLPLLKYRIRSGSVSMKNRSQQMGHLQNIISEFSAWSTIFIESIDKLDEIVNQYQKVPSAYSRMLLFTRDLILCGRYLNQGSMVIRAISKIGLRNIAGMIGALLLLFPQKVSRNLYRKFLTLSLYFRSLACARNKD